MDKRTEKISEMRRKLSMWAVPVVIAVTLPAHAQTSGPLNPPGYEPGQPPQEPPGMTPGQPPIPECPEDKPILACSVNPKDPTDTHNECIAGFVGHAKNNHTPGACK